MAVNLEKLTILLDEALSKETPESINDFLRQEKLEEIKAGFKVVPKEELERRRCSAYSYWKLD